MIPGVSLREGMHTVLVSNNSCLEESKRTSVVREFWSCFHPTYDGRIMTRNQPMGFGPMTISSVQNDWRGLYDSVCSEFDVSTDMPRRTVMETSRSLWALE